MATASLLPNGETQFIDGNGVPYAAGKVYFYIPNTSTPKNTWQDPTELTLNTNPIILDAAGRAVIYGNGSYRQVLQDSLGNTVWDQLTYGAIVLPSPNVALDLLHVNSAGNDYELIAPSSLLISPTKGTISRTLANLFSDTVNVLDYGAKGDGTTDDYASVNAAMATGAGIIYFPPGTYKLSATLNLTSVGQTLQGAGRGATVLDSISAGAVISLGNNPTYSGVRDMFITRTGTPGAAQSGIDTTGGTANFNTLENLVITNQYCGLSLGACGPSLVRNCYIQQCYSHGILIENSSVSPNNAYWTLEDNLCQLNDGSGIFIITTPSGGPMGIGPIINCSTFANSGSGISVIGTVSEPVNALRIYGGFYGQDGSTEISIDSASGFPQIISNVETELAGTYSGTGHAQTTPASNFGEGLLISATCATVDVTNFVARGHSESGIVTFGAAVSINGGELSYNGAASVSGNAAGIILGSGRAIVNGISIINNATYGVVFDNDNHIVTSCNISGNTTSAYNGTHSSSMVANNFTS